VVFRHESREAQVQHDGTAATAMLGLAGFVLLAVSEHDGEVEYAVETNDRVTGCPDCGVLARLHGRRRTDVRSGRLLSGVP
jgi:transposase